LLAEPAHSPAWSADAKELLFYSESGRAETPPGLWLFNPEQRNTYPLASDIPFKSTAWSPHRAYLASTLTTETGTRLVVWDLTQNRAFNGPAGAEPAWSPEGLRLAYRSCDETGWHISVIQVIGTYFDTTTLQHLTGGDDSQPAWSWDGQWLAFVRREAGNQDIYIIRADGSSLTRLTDHPAADISPAWTPGHRLVFRSQRDGQWRLYLMNADGSSQRQLVDAAAPPPEPPDRLAVSANLRVGEPPPPKPQLQIPAGQGLLAVSNRANNDEMTFTIDNVEHKIGPFELRLLPLNPGRYTWTASWPGKIGRGGIADIDMGLLA
jgi:TolB protein